MQYKKWLVSGLIVLLGLLQGCKDGTPSSSNTGSSRPPTTVTSPNTTKKPGTTTTPPTTEPGTNTTPPAGIRFTRLTFEEKIAIPNKEISALGRDGDGKYIYFGDKKVANKIFLFDRTANPLDIKDVSTCVAKNGKCVEHLLGDKLKNGAYYNAAYPGVKKLYSPDATQVTNVVAGTGNKALVSVTGLVSDQYYVWPGTFFNGGKTKKALGGVLQMGADQVIGVWGVTEESLNAGVDGKEISSLGVVGGSWVAFPLDVASRGAFRAFDEQPSKAHQIQVDNQNKIVTAAVGDGTNLFRAFNDGTIRRLSNAEGSLGNAGAADENVLDDAAALKVASSADANNRVTTLAVVGSKLLVGLAATAGQANGGVALIDINDPGFAVTAPPASHAGMSVKHIAVSKDNQSAWITTDGQGILYFKNDSFSQIRSAAPKSRAQNTNPLEFDGAKLDDAGREGFELSHAVVGATNIDNNWYVATDNEGIFLFTAEEVEE